MLPLHDILRPELPPVVHLLGPEQRIVQRLEPLGDHIAREIPQDLVHGLGVEPGVRFQLLGVHLPLSLLPSREFRLKGGGGFLWVVMISFDVRGCPLDLLDFYLLPEVGFTDHGECSFGVELVVVEEGVFFLDVEGWGGEEGVFGEGLGEFGELGGGGGRETGGGVGGDEVSSGGEEDLGEVGVGGWFAEGEGVGDEGHLVFGFEPAAGLFGGFGGGGGEGLGELGET